MTNNVLNIILKQNLCTKSCILYNYSVSCSAETSWLFWSSDQPQTHRYVFIWTRACLYSLFWPCSAKQEFVACIFNRFSRSYFGSYETHFWVNMTEEVTAVPHFMFYGHYFLRFRWKWHKYIFLFSPCWIHLEVFLYSDRTYFHCIKKINVLAKKYDTFMLYSK